MKILTLGQLIDTMKIGDIARSTKKMTNEDGYLFIQRYQSGFYVFNGQDIGDINKYDRLQLENCYTIYEWEILPRYVSFEKAMKALKEGYTVRWYGEEDSYIDFCEADTLYSISQDWTGLTFNDLVLKGKWLIVE